MEQAATCADCGARTLRLEWQRGGVDVLVEGPGKIADKIDAATNVALYRILDELPEGATPKGQRRKAPRVPFYVARGISEESARALVDRLRSIGLVAGAVPASVLAPKMRDKARQYDHALPRSVRWNEHLGTQALKPLRHAWGWPIFVSLLLAPFAFVVVAPLLSRHRPLVRETTNSSRTLLDADLSRALRVLVGSQDRRLVGRVLERVSELEHLGRRDIAEPLARRALLATRGLSAIDERRSADPAVSRDAACALAELRREEQARIFFRSDLLRTASRLDSANLIIARAAALQSSDEMAALDEQIRQLTLEEDAEEELREWLQQPS